MGDPVLVRAVFELLRRQYEGLSAQMAAPLLKAYCITPGSVEDTLSLQSALGRIRSLLRIRMGRQEEALMIQGLGSDREAILFFCDAISTCIRRGTEIEQLRSPR